MSNQLPNNDSRRIIAPISVVVSPLKSFLEIPLEPGGPYTTIEAQWLEVDGVSGIIVHLVSASGELDVYASQSLGLDDEWFRTDGSTAHMRRGKLATIDFGEATFETSRTRVELSLRFNDSDRRLIQVQVGVKRPEVRPRDAMFTPAVPGLGAMHQLRFLWMPEFWMLPRDGSQISVAVDGIDQAIATFPIPIAGQMRLKARFANGLSLISLNPSDGKANWVEVGDRVEVGDWSYVMDGSAVTAVMGPEADDRFSISFDPTLPLASRSEIWQKGSIRCHFGHHLVAKGEYSVRSNDGLETHIEFLNVVQRWRPASRSVSGHLLSMARRLKRRGQSAQWTYHNVQDETGSRQVESAWITRASSPGMGFRRFRFGRSGFRGGSIGD